MDLKKLIKGLPIEVRVNDVVTQGSVYKRDFVESCTGADGWAIARLGWRVILALMDEAEQKPTITPYKMPTFEKKPERDLGAVGGQSSDCVPPPKESRAVETSEEEVADAISKEVFGHGTRPDPFQGPHWDAIKHLSRDSMTWWAWQFLLCLRDLRDELRRMRGGE